MTDPALVKEIGAGLKQMRLNKNISQADLAEKAGIDRTTISRLEGGSGGTLITLVQVLRALDRLDILNVFREEPSISPIQLLKIQEKSRKYASSKRKQKYNARLNEYSSKSKYLGQFCRGSCMG